MLTGSGHDCDISLFELLADPAVEHGFTTLSELDEIFKLLFFLIFFVELRHCLNCLVLDGDISLLDLLADPVDEYW